MAVNTLITDVMTGETYLLNDGVTDYYEAYFHSASGTEFRFAAEPFWFGGPLPMQCCSGYWGHSSDGGYSDDNFGKLKSGTLTIPDPGSTLFLFGIGLVGLRAWRKRGQ